MVCAHRRLILYIALLTGACAAPDGPGPQQASFPPGQRTARSSTLTLELAEARYDLREVSLVVNLTNEGDAALQVDRQGLLLAYGELEFPTSPAPAGESAPETVLAAGASTTMELRFVIEQPLLEAATLHVMSVRDPEHADAWLEPLRLAIPPPAAFVDAAERTDDAS